MLIQFRFQNFKSFRDDTILDLSATKITEHGDHVVTIGKEKLLPVAAIFGANASGKSNVFGALFYMVMYVRESLSLGGNKKHWQEVMELLPKWTPFLFHSSGDISVSSFEVYFTRMEQIGRAHV